MGDDKRIPAMAEVIRMQGVQLMALELVVRALMATHPSPQDLHQVMRRLFDSNEQEIRDVGFLRGESPESAQRFAAYFSAMCERFLQEPSGKQSDP